MTGAKDRSIRRVLVLDDDPMVLRTLERYLRAPHLRIVSCSEIEAAESLLDRERFDVLVTDLEVSDLGGLEGMRLIRHASAHFPDLQVVVFSGKLDHRARRLGEALKADHMLQKPGEIKRLRELLADGLDLDSAPSEASDGGEIVRVGTLEKVLESRAISAVVQPILRFDRASGAWKPFGVEGLARGPRDSLLANPELLLQYASKKERLFDTELQCIEAVLGEARHIGWLEKLFINVRPRTLSGAAFAPVVAGLVRQYGFEPANIVLELTEQQSILNLRAFNHTLATLRDLGFGVALDDFGTGFANLSLLQELPLDYLKIDGFFCRDIVDDRYKQSIVRSSLAMARDLGIKTIVERVETAEELEIVASLGARFAQGYYFSRPASGRELAESFQPVPAGRSMTQTPRPGASAGVGEARDEVRHEMSNLLTAIALYSSQCLDRVAPDDPLRSDLEDILDATEKAVVLTHKQRSS